MNELPRISIVIPCYDGAQFLPAAIESCLRQTMRDFELIIVDDASPDNCAEIAERYAATDSRIRVLKRPNNGGVSEAFNTGFTAARGDCFTRLAQDDVFADDAFAIFLKYFNAHPGIGLLYCDYYCIDQHATVLFRTSVPEPDRALLTGNRLGLCVAWRREVWEAVGGFHKEYDTAEDYEYWLRVWNKFPIGRCPDGMPMFVRQHENANSIRFFERQERATLDALRNSYPTNVPVVRRSIMRRKAIARTFFFSSYEFRLRGNRRIALGRILRSLAAWPLPFSAGELKSPFGRAKLCVTLLFPKWTGWCRKLRGR